MVEFAISSIVLLLLMMGLLDLSRAFYFAVNLQGAAREGARHGAWFDTASRSNIFLDDSDVMSAVTAGLTGAGITCTGVNGINCFVPSATCLVPTDSPRNPYNNKPYAVSAFPATTQKVNVYICYTQPNNGAQFGTLSAHPTDNTWRLGDINVSLLMNFALITPFIQSLFGNGINMTFNEHFTIQGKP
jgi:Flp pilus assembly protein TadG